MEENNANVSTNLIPKSSMNYFYARLRAKNTNELDHPGFKFPSRLRINNDNPGLRLRKRTGVSLYRRRRSKKWEADTIEWSRWKMKSRIR